MSIGFSENGRPRHIEAYLITVRYGGWFGWSDSKNKIYANLIVHDGGSKPTEQECIDGLAQLQTDFDAQDYARSRAAAYASLGDQMDMQYWDAVNDTTTWADHIARVKGAYPK